MQKNGYKLLDFVGDTSKHTGKILAAYVLKMGASHEEVNPMVFMFESKGGVSLGTAPQKQGYIPLVTLGARVSKESARDHARDLLNRGYQLNRTWIN